MFDRKEKDECTRTWYPYANHAWMYLWIFCAATIASAKEKSSKQSVSDIVFVSLTFVLFFSWMDQVQISRFTKFQINPPKYILFWLFRLLLFVVVGFSFQKARIYKKNKETKGIICYDVVQKRTEWNSLTMHLARRLAVVRQIKSKQ
jgi:hypothetical protein